jgi:hypothetical protein
MVANAVLCGCDTGFSRAPILVAEPVVLHCRKARNLTHMDLKKNCALRGDVAKRAPSDVTEVQISPCKGMDQSADLAIVRTNERSIRARWWFALEQIQTGLSMPASIARTGQVP